MFRHLGTPRVHARIRVDSRPRCVRNHAPPFHSIPSTDLSSATTPLSNLVTPITSIAATSGDDLSVSASPLQRMASITNSLMTGPPISTGSPLTQKPLKAVLPPITQQQFDQYSNMNTEEIVKKVSERPGVCIGMWVVCLWCLCMVRSTDARASKMVFYVDELYRKRAACIQNIMLPLGQYFIVVSVSSNSLCCASVVAEKYSTRPLRLRK